MTVFIAENIKLSFFTYNYKFIKPLISQPYFQVASILDIACMKLAAIVSRASFKDYLDLYFIFQEIPLELILKGLNRKYPELDTNLVLKSLLYFKDLKAEPIKFKNNKNISLKIVEKYLKEQVFKL